MIPHGERYYSAFPLGAVLSMVPIALPAESPPNPRFSRTRISRVDCGFLCLFLFSTRKGIWSQLFQVRQQLTRSPDFARLVPHFWDVDVVQPRVRWRLANRSRSSLTGRNCSALFHLGATISDPRRSVLRAGFWQSHRAAHHAAPLSLLSLGSRKRNRRQLVPD